MSNETKRSGVPIIIVILLMVISALSVAVVMLLLERKNTVPPQVPSIEEKVEEILAAEEKTENAPVVEEKTEDVPVVEEEKKEKTPAVEEEKKEEPPADEEKTEESPVVEEKTKESPTVEEKTEESTAVEEKTEESPAVEEKKEEPSAVDLEKLTQSGDKASLEKAASLGYVPAQVKLGKLCEENDDYESAAHWFELAAQKADPEANEKLGRYYLHGMGGKPKNFNTAQKYLENAANAGQISAMKCLGYFNFYTKKYDYALDWFRKSAAQGDPESIYRLGLMYENGDGVVRDHKEAFEYFKSSAEKGYEDAWVNLGIEYLLGQGTDKDLQEANRWIGKAAKAGIPTAQMIMGDICQNGWGVPADDDTAASWYEKASLGGDKQAKEKLALLKQKQAKAKEKPAQTLPKETPKAEKKITQTKPKETTPVRRKTERPQQPKRTASSPGIYKATLDLKLDGPTRVRVGDHFKYVVSVRNSGSDTAENVVVSYTLPIGISLISDPSSKSFTLNAGSMAPGSKKTANIEVVADYAGIFINTVSVSGSNTHPKNSSLCTKVINRR